MNSRLWVTVAVMAATVMQVLDTTIVNVALPQMQGELGATSDQISWVLTSYLVASAICMPLTGYLTDRLGRRRYLLYSISGFVIASMLCGVAMNLTQIVLFRLLQGVFGAALVPLSQAIMVDNYPREERGRAMAIWADCRADAGWLAYRCFRLALDLFHQPAGGCAVAVSGAAGAGYRAPSAQYRLAGAGNDFLRYRRHPVCAGPWQRR